VQALQHVAVDCCSEALEQQHLCECHEVFRVCHEEAVHNVSLQAFDYLV